MAEPVSPKLLQNLIKFRTRSIAKLPLYLKALNRGPLGILAVCLNAGLVMSSMVLFGWLYELPAPPHAYPLEKTTSAPTERELILKTADGETFARRGGCYGGPVKLEDVPRHLVDALLAMEDRRFYSHFGIDPLAIMRAARVNYRAGRIVQGGSTITQQLAKLAYLSSARTYDRKAEEAIVVLRLELALTKNQILERYLSRAYFGESCFGLRAAARHYFGTTVNKLTVAQSAQLVALLKSPGALARAEDRLQHRTRLVLHSMVQNGSLSSQESAEVELATRSAITKTTFAGYYSDWIAGTVQTDTGGELAPLPVRTSFAPALQKAAEAAVAKYMSREGPRRKATQSAMVVMRPDGRVLAMVGGVNYGESTFNRATQALRQPGSSFKSFVYLAAARAGGHPGMQAYDQPIQIGDWAPENYDHGNRGAVSLLQAFSSSINTVAVQVSEAVGRKHVVEAATDLGISSQLHSDPSIALGTSEVNLLELTSAYAAFSADAYPVMPWGVLSTGGGQSGPGAPPLGAGRWKLPEGATMRQYLSATVQYGTGRGARLPIPAYGKTGTSQNYRDAWFIGFAGNLVVGVWIGNDDNSPTSGVTGGNLPTIIWREFMGKAMTIDKAFSPRLSPVAAFADAVAKRGNNQSASLQTLLAAYQPELLPEDPMSGAYFERPTFGNPMLFGPFSDQGAPAGASQPRRTRVLDGWVNRMDGS